MSATQETKISRHWATILLGLIVAAIFLVIIFSFQVKSTEFAVITTMGKISGTTDAGLHFRWPYPVQSVYKFDKRIRCFEGTAGKLEETLTRDAQNVLIGIYISYRIQNPEKFFNSWITIDKAEEDLNKWMRSDKDQVIGKYNFDQLINTDSKKMQLGEMEKQICISLNNKTQEKYGVEIVSVGINSINIPEKTTKSVFDRMIAERSKVSTQYRAEGKNQADTIKMLADSNKMKILTDARAAAKRIRAEGDAAAAKYFADFQKNPELAMFLRKLDSLKKVMGAKTTLILDTDSAPFDILKPNSDKLDNGPIITK